MILALILFQNNSGLSQGLIISPGTSIFGTAGNLVLRGNVVNDGSFSNDTNTVIFAGGVQSLGGTSPVLFNNLTVAAGSTTSMITTGQTLKGILVSNNTLNANGNIIFKIKKLEGDFFYKTIYFYDVITGINQDLLPEKQYKVNLIAGDYQNRFFLILSGNTTDIPDFTPVEDWIDIYSFQGILKAEIKLPSCKNGTLTIYNLLGQARFIYKIYEPGYHEFNPVIKTGFYIVTFSSNDKRFSKKIFLQSQ